jgi:acetyltransferase-like isoleucine patch superfamily enzyme
MGDNVKIRAHTIITKPITIGNFAIVVAVP